MKDQQRFKLIDGNFTPAEAERVLLALVQSKIDYHSLQKLSDEERFGRDVSLSEKRLQDLKELKGSLKELFDSTTAEKLNLRIDGWIEITLRR